MAGENAEDRLSLSSWGLPAEVLQKYHNVGIYKMFEWQADCLCTGDVLDGGNLVYSAPTSAGKTMVAELLLLKRVLEIQKKAIIVLPFVSVAREKMMYLQNMFEDVGVIVDGFMGGQNPPGGFAAVNIAVCTIEKANGLINRLLEEGKINNLGMIIVDELHMIGDNHRGYLLELMLTKIKFMLKKKSLNDGNDSELVIKNPIQIIGMSATLPNLDLLSRWLNANLYTTDFRPVPLTEMIKIGEDILDSNFCSLRKVKPELKCKDDDQIIQLCLETISEGCSVLIFCPSKAWCESLADSIAREFYSFINNPNHIEYKQWKVNIDQKALFDVCEQLRRTPVGLDVLLGRTVPQGVAFHHAGLTFDERDIVEGAFRQMNLKVLVATSTLSSGVNLPARRVIVRTPTFHGATLIDTLTYKQMIGRAGRKGVDTKGESILVCKSNEKSKAEQLVKCSLPPVRSCLQKSGESGLSSSMKRAILEVVVSGVAGTPAEVKAYAESTMLAASMESATGSGEPSAIECCIKFLQDNEFITLVQGEGDYERYISTQLGSAVLASALSPDEGLVVFQELRKARKCFVLENELHILYLVTPIYMVISQVNWWDYMSMWEKLSPDMKRVAELVGVSESFLSKAVSGNIKRTTAIQNRLYNVHLRFYTCLVLHDLINEMSLNDVCSKFKCNRGTLQSLQQSAATFAGMVTVFCHKLGWINLELLLSQFQSRLTFGVQRELIDLVRISLLNGQRARTMFNGGYQTIASLANADPVDIEVVLKKSAPFMSKKKGEEETEWEAEQRKQSHCIWLTGKKGLTESEAAMMIVEEARQLLKRDLKEIGVEWKPPEDAAEEKTMQKESQRRSIGLKRRKRSVDDISKNDISVQNKSGNRSILNASKKMNRTGFNSGEKKINVSVLSPPPAYIQHRTSQGSGQKMMTQQKLSKVLSGVKTDPLCLFNVSGELDLTCLDCESPKLTTPNRKCSKKRCASSMQKLHVRKSPRLSENKTMATPLQDEDDHSKSVSTNAVISPKQSSKRLFKDISSNTVNVNLYEKTGDDSKQHKIISHQKAMKDLDTFNIDSQTDKILEQLTPVRWKPSVSKEDHNNIKDHVNFDESIGQGNGSFLLPASAYDKLDECEGLNNGIFLSPASEKSESQNNIDVAFSDSLCEPSPTFKNTDSDGLQWEDANQSSPQCKIDGKNRFSQGEENHLHMTTLGDSILAEIDFGSPVAIHGKDEAIDENIYNVCSKADVEHDISIQEEGQVETIQSKNSDNVYRKSGEIEEPVEGVNKEQGENEFKLSPGTLSAMQQCVEFTQYDSFDNVSLVNGGNSNLKPKIQTVPQHLEMNKANLMENDCKTEGFDGNERNKVVYIGDRSIKKKGQIENVTKRTIKERQSLLNCQSRPEKELAQSGCKIKENLAQCQTKGDNSVGDVSENESSVSECLPPTPDSEQTSRNNTPTRLIGGTGKTPKRSQRLFDKQLATEAYNSNNLFSPQTPINIHKKHSKQGTQRTGKTGSDVLTAQMTSTPNAPGKKSSPGGQLFMSPGLEVSRKHLNSAVGNNSPGLNGSLSSTNQSFAIIDVCSNAELFNMFVSEWKEQEKYAISLACDKLPSQPPIEPMIGEKFIPTKSLNHNVTLTTDGIVVEAMNLLIVGLAISWANRDTYYIALTNDNNTSNLDNSLAQPDLDPNLSIEDRIKVITDVLSNKSATVIAFDIKDHYKALCLGLGLYLTCQIEDPKVADWLMDPGNKEKNLHRMVHSYLPMDVYMLEGIGGGMGVSSIGLNAANPGSGRLRSCIESVLVQHLSIHFTKELEQLDLLSLYKDIEVPNCVILARMEMNGMGFDPEECSTQKYIMQAKLAEIEQQAYTLAGHPFSLSSSSDISQVLFLELRLPPSGDPNNPGFTRSLGTTRRSTRAKQQYSTAKEVLEKLQGLHPLPVLILEWRKVSNTLTKVVFPLMKEKLYCTCLDMYRLHGDCQTFTSTGRVSMQEPNFQNIPKAFDIGNYSAVEKQHKGIDLNQTLPVCINMRQVFVPFEGGVILAADYSQLELRVIAHLSKDKQLIEILNSNMDVFKMIAAKWKGITVNDVSASQRQQAKQICYGMIYGIGAKALGEQLNVDINEANMFIESFKNRFKGMKLFLRDTVNLCREKGYVETMLKRRRYLPAIRDLNIHAKAHAERQSVNTTVQGSAADIVKKAMIQIDRELTARFPHSIIPHQAREKLTKVRGAFFILQLHDELIYEVCERDLERVKGIVRYHMENATKLSVHLPVKLSVGKSWGQLDEET